MSSHILDNRFGIESSSRYAALSVRQPWAYLIVMGQKTIDLRRRPFSYRGLLVIHASAKVDEAAMYFFDLQDSGLDTGCLVGAVELVDAIEMTRDDLRKKRWEHRSFGPFPDRMFGLVLSPIQVFPRPIPASGNQGLFYVTDRDTKLAIEEQLKGLSSMLHTS